MKQKKYQAKNVLPKTIKISQVSTATGFKIWFGQDKKQGISYQSKVFARLSHQARQALADNFVYARTRQLTLCLDAQFSYDFARPMMADFTDYGIIQDLGKIAEMNKLSTKGLITAFKQAQLSYARGKHQPVLPAKKTKASNVLLAISFGKDSLLSYGLARELKLNISLAFVRELEDLSSAEARHKLAIIKEFTKKEKVKVAYMFDDGDAIFDSKQLTKDLVELENTNGMLAFVLELLPLAYLSQSRYLILGNEANFMDSFMTHDGYRAYPSFDQSIVYGQKLNQALIRFTGNNLQSLSLVEPIYNLAEMHLLYHRYPDLVPYLMSCDSDKLNSARWCYQCPTCAEIFLYSQAVGGDARLAKFHKNFFAKEYRKFYVLFNKNIKRAYEQPPAVRDEQLLAFLLAYQRGATGYLIDLFVQEYLAEAKKREKTLRAKFFGIHPSTTIPPLLKTKILNIYKQELVGLL